VAWNQQSPLAGVGGGGGGATSSRDDLNLATLATVDDEDQAGPAITDTPAGAVKVFVSGALVDLRGDKTGFCYFSGNGGATARALDAIQAGDTLHWMGSVAGYELENGWHLAYDYET
jgi:hypothetical protein